jgi:DNA-binding NarL/FixJ family response regulator
MTVAGGKRIRVVICDDVPDMRRLLRSTLEDDPDVDVVGEAADGEELVQVAAQLRPDVVLVDLSMPRSDGLEAIPRIASASPSTGIVVFSGFGAERMRRLTLERGADRYIAKGEPLEALHAAVREVARAGDAQGAAARWWPREGSRLAAG